MTTLEFSAPSKTFLLGEYAVLAGAPALLLTSSPRFILNVTKTNTLANNKTPTGIHPQSPAGKFINLHANFYRSYQLKFIDPYQGLGGFGASSAQFLLVSALKNYFSNQPYHTNLLIDYQNMTWEGTGLPPSGVDLLAQLYGNICYIDKLKNETQIFSWTFPELDYALIHTGYKIATHTHLQHLDHFNIPVDFKKIIHSGRKSFATANQQQFISSIQNYAQVLLTNNLTMVHSIQLLQLLHKHPSILAAKACGALGADVIFILFKKTEKSIITTWLEEINLRFYLSQTTVPGLEIKEIINE